MCDITGRDLTRFFRLWGGFYTPFDDEVDDYGKKRITVTQTQIDRTIADIKAKGYPEVDEKIEYICDANWKVFKNRLPVQPGTATKSGTKITMKGWQNVLLTKFIRMKN